MYAKMKSMIKAVPIICKSDITEFCSHFLSLALPLTLILYRLCSWTPPTRQTPGNQLLNLPTTTLVDYIHFVAVWGMADFGQIRFRP